MGYIAHRALVLVGSDHDASISEELPMRMTAAHQLATELGLRPSPLTETAENDYVSFFIPPDGSKEGWAASDENDQARDEFIAWLKLQVYEDGSGPIDWADIRFGGDEPDKAEMLRANRK
jgi:hypothetical protein